MIALRRLVWTNLRLPPSCLSLACQRYVKEFSSNVSVQGREEGTDLSDVIKDASGSRKTRRQPRKTESIKDLIQKFKLLKKGSKGSSSKYYLMDRSIAETLVTYLKRDLGEEDILVDMSPGLGILTETLLEETSNSVVAYESNNKLQSNLVASLLPQYGPRLQIQTQDFHKFYGFYIVNQREPENTLLQDFLNPMLRRVRKSYAPVKILGLVHNVMFVRRLIYSFTFQCCLFENLSPDLYLFVPHKLYTEVHGRTHSYRSISHIFQCYFDMETLLVVSKKAFYPILKTKKNKRDEEDKAIYLVKISPKKDFLDKVRWPNYGVTSFKLILHSLCLSLSFTVSIFSYLCLPI